MSTSHARAVVRQRGTALLAVPAAVAATPSPLGIAPQARGDLTTLAAVEHDPVIIIPGTLGCTTHPVILWNNGARSKLDRYLPLLNHLAPHNFTIAAEGNAGNAGPMP
ncbi:hypothetical protein [Actinokineospora spheciospongiae]|uniref:hypothetical protein n=1 Tax=Actinokineospora spheciospongiae TaxID=909613 RepID=UPI000D8693D3|nr:hypothetical protein [Actinokineospora spheciospongiae]PWW60354.1 hypothetical protein DFQ13_107151 [Actinokineospora spheciospongiae]